MAFSFMPQDNVMQQFSAPADPSYMQPSAPRQTNVMQMMQPPAQAPEPPRKRTSVLDIIGGIADTFAEMGGATPMYQRNVDARTKRDRETELYPLEVQKAQLNNQKSRQEMMFDQNKMIGQAASYVQRAYANGGAQGGRNVLGHLLGRLGIEAPQIEAELQQYDADPVAYTEGLSVFSGGGKAKTYEVGNSLVQDNGDGTTKVLYTDPNKKEEPIRYVTMRGSEGDGIYMFRGEENLGMQGGVVRAPSAGRQPNAYDRKVAALRAMNVPEDQIPAIASGLADSPLKTKGAGGSKAEKQRADMAKARTRLKAMIDSPEFQSGYGLEVGASKGANTLAGVFTNDWQPAPETADKEAQIAVLKQMTKEALTQGKVDSNKDWERIEPLWPNMTMNAAQQRARMTQIMDILDEISTGIPAGDAEPPPADEGGAAPSVSNW